jgi:23S rRNA-/tRNA-specific pseudouridylate synthase
MDNGAIDSNDDGRMKKRVNLVHRLDRGASGALLFALADDNGDNDEFEEDNIENTLKKKKGATARLQEEMNNPASIKTYIALVRGEGILHGEDLKKKGWFEVNRPIKDEKGKLNDAITFFRFVAGQKPEGDDYESTIAKPRMTLVLARPKNGRWHQIRRHLNGLSHHILGDRAHGCSKTNKEWKEKRNLPGERLFLHLARLQLPPTEFTSEGIDCSCPLPKDMLDALNTYGPDILRDALPILEDEGIFL